MRTSLIVILKLSAIISCMLYFSCAKDNEANIKLDVYPDALTFQPGGEMKTFNISCSGEWQISADGLWPFYGRNGACTDWFEVSPVNGTGDAQIIIQTTEDSYNNNIVLYIKCNKKEMTVTLNQN